MQIVWELDWDLDFKILMKDIWIWFWSPSRHQHYQVSNCPAPHQNRSYCVFIQIENHIKIIIALTFFRLLIGTYECQVNCSRNNFSYCELMGVLERFFLLRFFVLFSIRIERGGKVWKGGCVSYLIVYILLNNTLNTLGSPALGGTLRLAGMRRNSGVWISVVEETFSS